VCAYSLDREVFTAGVTYAEDAIPSLAFYRSRQICGELRTRIWETTCRLSITNFLGELGLSDRIPDDASLVTMYRFQTTLPLGLASRPYLDIVHQEARHNDIPPKSIMDVFEPKGVKTLVALNSGMLCVELHSGPEESAAIEQILMRPGDALEFDPTKDHSFVPVGEEPRESYSVTFLEK